MRRRMIRGCRGAARGRARMPSRRASGRRWSASGTLAPTPLQRELLSSLCLMSDSVRWHEAQHGQHSQGLRRIFFAGSRVGMCVPSVGYSGCRAYNREREAAAERRRAAEADAYARSRKILEEELARDRAWRDAVKQVRSPECFTVFRA